VLVVKNLRYKRPDPTEVELNPHLAKVLAQLVAAIQTTIALENSFAVPVMESSNVFSLFIKKNHLATDAKALEI